MSERMGGNSQSSIFWGTKVTMYLYHIISSWWLNQPILKICASQIEAFFEVGIKIIQFAWNQEHMSQAIKPFLGHPKVIWCHSWNIHVYEYIYKGAFVYIQCVNYTYIYNIIYIKSTIPLHLTFLHMIDIGFITCIDSISLVSGWRLIAYVPRSLGPSLGPNTKWNNQPQATLNPCNSTYLYIWVYPQIILFNTVFHSKPSILGYPYFWKHPYIYIYIWSYLWVYVHK